MTTKQKLFAANNQKAEKKETPAKTVATAAWPLPPWCGTKPGQLNKSGRIVAPAKKRKTTHRMLRCVGNKKGLNLE